jgi:hypothetical protein
MAIEEDVLDAAARAYVGTMSSIRGRRVHRLLMRELSRFDHVLPVAAEDGAPALLALGEDGRVSVCQTDGRGATVAVAEWARLEGATVTSCDSWVGDDFRAPPSSDRCTPRREEQERVTCAS